MTPLKTELVAEMAGESVSHLHYKLRTGSTNDDLIELARGGAPHRSTVVAEEQDSGRGRRGAVWHCPPGEGLAFSWLCGMEELAGKGLLPSLLAGLALARALRKFDLDVQVKWPNDLFIEGKKIAGILTESVEGHVVIGIGINVSVTDFPEDFAATASSLHLASGRAFSREEVLAGCLRELEKIVTEDSAGAIDELRDLCALTGRAVSLTTNGRRLEGHVRGLGDGGELLFWTGRTTLPLTQADEIRIEE